MEHKSKLPDHRPLLKEEKIGDDEEAYFANDMPCRKYKLVTLLWPKNQQANKVRRESIPNFSQSKAENMDSKAIAIRRRSQNNETSEGLRW